MTRTCRAGGRESKVAAWQRTQGPRPEESKGRRQATGELTRGDWLTFLQRVLALRQVRYVGLLQHHYRSSTADESFEIRRERRTLTEVTERAVPWDENVLYEIVAD